MDRKASLLVEEKGLFSVSLVINRWKRCGKAELSFSHSHTQISGLAMPQPRIFLLTSISSSTMCTLPSDPFVESFYSLKKTFQRLQSTDGTTFNIARPSSAPPILMTPSSTIGAANIAMPVFSKIHFDLPAPK